MSDKDKIIEDLLVSKIKIVADRNQRFAAIGEELEELQETVNEEFIKLNEKIRRFKI